MSTGLGDWAYVAAVIVGSFLVGLAVDIVGVGILGHKSGPGVRGRVAVAKALRGQVEVWAVLLGIAMFKPFEFLPTTTRLWTHRLVT